MSKFINIILLFIISNIFNCAVLSTANGKVQNLSLEKLSVEDGLSQGTVNAMLQDDTGFIWMGTENGVNIYDGYTIRQLPGPEGNFNNFGIYNLMKDKQGLIWMNAYGKGLYSYDTLTDKYQFIQTNINKDKNYNISDIIEGENGDIWVLTSKSLGLYNKNTKIYQQVLDLNAEILANKYLLKMALKNEVVFIASTAGIIAFNTQSKQWRKLPDISNTKATDATFHIDESSKVYTLNISENNQLYLGTHDGLFVVDVGNIKSYIAKKRMLPKYELILENVSLWQVYIEEGFFYAGTDKGLYKVDFKDNNTEFLFGYSDYFDNITNESILSILKDNNGTFWLGSNATGVYRWNPKREFIQNYRYKKNNPSSLSFNEVWNILPQKNSNDLIWVSTSNGLNLIDNNSHIVKQFIVNPDTKSVYNESYIYQIVELSPNQLLLSTAVGIRIFDTQLEKLIALPFNEKIKTLLAKEQFNIYFKDDILWVINTKGIFQLNLISGVITDYPKVLEKISADNLWGVLGYLPDSDLLLISSNNALWALNGNNKEIKQLYLHPDVLDSEYVSIDNWAIDNDNILWLSFSSKGLVGLTLPDFKQKYFYHKGNSIIDDNVYGVMKDQEGDIWFSTHGGIFMLNTENQHIRHFTIEDGFPAMEYNSKAYSHLKDHQFAYGSMEGVSFFDPLVLKKLNKDKTTNLKITNINVLSRKLNLPLSLSDNKEILLEHDDVGIRIDFSTFSFSSRNKTSYEYRLMGKSTVNYPSTFENYITFPNLPSGQHVLEIRAKSSISGVYSKPTKLKIRVSYVPWLSPLAYFIYLVIFISITLSWYSRRSKQRRLLLAAHEEVKFRENRLQLALTGSNSEVWDWQSHDNLMFGKRISQELGYVDLASSHSFEEHVELIHPNDRISFVSTWQSFLASADLEVNFSCTYRMVNSEGEWLWYKDLGKIVAIDTEGNATRITGSYTNITQSRADEERAQHYGEAFKQTKDWVLIITEDFQHVTANQSFRDVFKWSDEQFQFDHALLGINKVRWKFYRQLLPTLVEGQHWSGEELIETEAHEEFHVLVNINVSRNEATKSLHYICVFTDITAQKIAEKELRYMANYDHLTDLPNRSLLLERIKHAMDFSKRKSLSIALFFIDLDKFKQVNDSLGHEFGDMLLVEITRRLTNILRVDDTVARIGGDEFVVLLESFRGSAQLGHIAQKIIAEVEKPVTLDGNIVSIGASIGIALYPDDAKNSKELLRHADVAMYHAKQIGRNTFQFFTPRMNFEASVRLQKESNIKMAHKNNEFINHYQPIVDEKVGKVVGVEMLMRWQSSEGLIPPFAFISIAEELGLIIPMTELALDRGLADLNKWHKFAPEMFLSVNLSAQHFLKDSLVPYVSSLLKKHNFSPSILKFEVTESALISEPEKAISTMKALSELGVTLALDDFGTGYSSLEYLKKLPLDIIKIDRSFVSGIGEEEADEAIVDATLVLAKRLGMGCIAEGVETKAQLDYLTKQECHLIQGYIYSKPIDSDGIVDCLKQKCIEKISAQL